MNFKKLTNLDLNDFFLNHFEKNILISKVDLNFNDVIKPVSSWEKSLLELMINNKDLTFVKNSLKVDTKFFINNGKVDHTRMSFLHQNNFTFYLKKVEKYFSEIEHFVKELERELYPFKIQTNLFMSCANHIGLLPHFDCHDIFVLQLHGQKNWKCWQGFVQNMDYERPLDSDLKKALVISEKMNPILDYNLSPNELMYLPRGVIHAPYPVTNSTHLTFWLKSPLVENIKTDKELDYEKERNNYLYF